MKLQPTKDQPRRPEACDYCAGAETPDLSSKKVKRFNIFPYGTFVLCVPHETELRNE